MLRKEHAWVGDPLNIRCYLNFGGGSTDSGYSRKGTTTNERYKKPDSFINGLVNDNLAGAAVPQSLVTQQQGVFGDIMAKTDAQSPGYAKFNELMEKSTTTYPGSTRLAEFTNIAPYSGAYETTTADAYKQRASDAMAQVASGPDAVRGGADRTGIMQGVAAERLAQGRGEEVRRAQLQDVGVVNESARTANASELGRGALVADAAKAQSGAITSQNQMQLNAGRAVDMSKLNNLGLLQLASGLTGTSVDLKTDATSGKGMQSSDNWGTGISCCFIFLEVLNGELPWYINIARREYRTGARRTGYVWMAKWLVPMMRNDPWWKRMVNMVIVQPFLRYGACLYKDISAKPSGWLYAPYCHGWLRVWGTLGHFVKV